MDAPGDRPHALLIPMPQQGHWDPMKRLIQQLVNVNISFTLLSTPTRILEMQALKDKGEFERVEHARFVVAFDDFGKTNGVVGAVLLNRLQTELLRRPSVKEEFLAYKSSGCGPTFIIADMFLYWTQDIADELGIPRYTFFTSPTAFALLILHAPALIAKEWEPRSLDRAKREQVVNYPGLEHFRVGDIPAAIYKTPESYRLHSKYLLKAAGIVINSFLPYEAEVAVALHAQIERAVGDAKVPNIFLIGPLLYLSTFSLVQTGKQSAPETDNSGCLHFLDTQPETSVLYICFGSQSELKQSLIIELARGLELSEVPFLWVLPHPSSKDALPSWNVSQVLPEGFESRTKERGIVWTSWAPQKEILDHPSVGGFLSHCGWNSVIESIRGGVPILPLPLYAEQHMNARFLVTTAKVAVEIQQTAEGEFVGEEIAKAVRLLMNSEEGKDKRLNMQALQISAIAAVRKGGPSQKDLLAFLQEVAHLPSRGGGSRSPI